MSEQRSKFEEQALDAFLVEVLGKVEPPDLKSRILKRLSEHDGGGELGAIVAASSRPKTVSRPPVARRAMPWALAVTTALAVSILLVVWMRGDQAADQDTAIAANQQSVPDSLDPVAVGPDALTQADAEQTLAIRSRGIPLKLDTNATTLPEDRPDPGASVPEVRSPVAAVTLVSKKFDSELLGYWTAIGIQPAAEADPAEVVARLTSILGVQLPAEAVSDPEQLQQVIARNEVAREIAFRWLQQITDRGMQRLDQESRDKLTSDLAACLQGNQPFDRTVASWIDGESPLSSSFYGVISHAGQDAMVRRVASLTMNVDLRCTRCHDATIEGIGHQRDYWSFAALLARGVSRGADGRVTIDPESNKSNRLFYELADGRQSLAEPSVSKQWIDSPASPPAQTVKAWAAQLLGSEAMARGAVNSLWQLIHGQPLRGRVVDPFTAPHNDALDRIEDQLVQDLVRSRFDVARTLSLIIASPATRRAVPAPLLPENALVVSESDKLQAINAVNAFAAALPRPVDLSLNQRLDQVNRAMGGKLDQDGRPFVAQLGGTGDERNVASSGSSSKPLADDFPVRGESLPVQWLTLIGNEQGQIDHLGYLAGMQRLPESVQDAVKAMQADDQVSKELMLNRVWWLVRP